MTKILLIDDEEAYLENLNTLLEEEGFETVTASNGMDGIDAAKTSQPDLIVCDIMLPDISGYMILEELRKRESTKLIPFSIEVCFWSWPVKTRRSSIRLVPTKMTFPSGSSVA